MSPEVDPRNSSGQGHRGVKVGSVLRTGTGNCDKIRGALRSPGPWLAEGGHVAGK